MERNAEIENYAAAVHGAMSVGYGLLIPYHLKRRNWLYVGIGILGALWHGYSVTRHTKPSN